MTKRPKYVTLRVVENTIKEATEEVEEQLQAYEIEFENSMQVEQSKADAQFQGLADEVDRLLAKQRKGELVNPSQLALKQQALAQQQRSSAERKQRIAEEMRNERNAKVRGIRLTSEVKIQEIQRKYKLAAVLIPADSTLVARTVRVYPPPLERARRYLESTKTKIRT